VGASAQEHSLHKIISLHTIFASNPNEMAAPSSLRRKLAFYFQEYNPPQMALTPGVRPGPYEIVSVLGRTTWARCTARYTRLELERTVAIKILRQQLSNDPVRKQRFKREAKTISSLNHPHICLLYDVAHQDGIEIPVSLK
jgi:serine/threonine protein kinase